MRSSKQIGVICACLNSDLIYSPDFNRIASVVVKKCDWDYE